MNYSKKPTTTHMVVLHKETEYIEAAVQLLAAQWKHSKFEQMRNQRSMIEDSKDTLPCHLALIDSQDDVVAHVKLTRADGRSDGSCAIFYSLVVALEKRGLGYGRRMSELAEEFCVALGFAYVYLSTPDMASFYLHLGYKECEPVSSLGNNSKRLTASQVSSIEGIFAKRLNVAPPTEANVWLRRRLIQEFPLREHILLDDMQSLLKSQLETGETMFGCVIKVQSQQQSGPSCGISVLNMFNSASTLKSILLSHKLLLECCSCTILSPNELVEPKTCLDWALKLGISNDGEIFCAFNFALLAKAAYSVDLEVVDVSDIDEKLLRLKIATSICNGWPVLVAYDRTLSDHLPCESNGSLAHWALIFGFITTDSISGSEKNVNCVSNSNVTLFEVDGNKTEVKLDKDDVGDQLDIVCYHGMSPRPFVCSLESMLASNRQLMTCKSKFYRHSNDLKHLRNKLLFIKESS